MPGIWAWFRLRVALTFSFALFALLFVLLINITGTLEENLVTSEVNSASKDFFWIDIEPTHELIWHACYKPLRRECARLLVPLNHLNHSDEFPDHAAIALIRIPSPLSESSSSRPHPRYRGPILFNPGGPGGSGVEFIHKTGDLLAQILGSEFDIVSFDPRGVGRSTPKVAFYEAAGRGEREVWSPSDLDVIRGGVGDKLHHIEGEKGRSLEATWAHAIVGNERAKEHAGQWLGNVNTEQTAYDMLSIVRAHGREKLMYWGFSYGTVLGSTFASLFPDNIERIILDGVVDADDYYASGWETNLFDTPKTLYAFFKTCHDAGPACDFWAPSPSLIAENLTRIYEDLVTNPIPVRTSTSYGVLDYPKVRGTIFSMLYSPWASWPILAQALGDLGGPNRDPGLMYRLTEVPTFKCPCSGSCDSKSRLEKEFEAHLQEARTAIVCSDGLDIPSDVASAKRYFEKMSRDWEWADLWANVRLSCAGWPKVKKGYQGPVGANTSFPLLFIGNTADPVTPVLNAKSMSKRFPGSQVLVQDSPGHCSINAPSVCTLSHVREYFLSGKLPPDGIVCPTDGPSPFPGADRDNVNEPSAGSVQVDTRDRMKILNINAEAEEVTIMKATARRLARTWKPFDQAFLRREMKDPREFWIQEL